MDWFKRFIFTTLFKFHRKKQINNKLFMKINSHNNKINNSNNNSNPRKVETKILMKINLKIQLKTVKQFLKMKLKLQIWDFIVVIGVVENTRHFITIRITKKYNMEKNSKMMEQQHLNNVKI